MQTVTVPEAQVNDKAPTSIDFNVQVEAGKRYALALTTDPLGQQDAPVTQPTYDWVNKDIGLNDTLPSGKINPSGAWVDETKYINTLWCKMHYASESENVPPVDFTFDTSDTTWGYGVGARRRRSGPVPDLYRSSFRKNDLRGSVFCFPRAERLLPSRT